jgi:hypothetical protein
MGDGASAASCGGGVDALMVYMSVWTMSGQRRSMVKIPRDDEGVVERRAYRHVQSVRLLWKKAGSESR